MNITLIYVGNIKEPFFAMAVAEYEKRISGYARLKSVEIKEARSSDSPTDGEIAAILQAEGKRIIEALPKKSYKIALCVEGGQMSSEELAARLERVALQGFGEVTFIIGGSWGLSDEVKAACDCRLSFSKMTFPHRLMRVMLLEQLYRAQTISAGAKYHK